MSDNMRKLTKPNVIYLVPCDSTSVSPRNLRTLASECCTSKIYT